MNKLPRPAQLYLILVYLLGAVAAGFAIVTPLPKVDAAWWELGAYLVLAGLASSWKIRLMRHRSAEDSVSLSLGYVLTCTALLRFGPAAAVLVGAFGAFVNSLFPYSRRQPAHQLLFNVSTAVIESWVAGMVFLWLNHHSLVLRNPGTYPAVAGFSLTYFLLNTGGVAIILALCTAQRPFAVWRAKFFWTAPSYFAGGCVSALAILLFPNQIGFVLLLLAPLGWIVHQNYSRTEQNQQYVEELKAGKEHLADLYLATIESLALAIDAKDQYTHQHILRVRRYAVATAHHMGITGLELEAINTGALLHDIGKLGVPEYVLLKPGRLTEEEFAKIKEHPQIGADILHPVQFPAPVLPVVRSHHEKWDGTGYPDGLKGEEIPRTARILAVADVYDALTSSRSYRSAWTHERACEVITKDRGTHFDPHRGGRLPGDHHQRGRGDGARGGRAAGRHRDAREGSRQPHRVGGARHPPGVVGAVGLVRGRPNAVVVSGACGDPGDPEPQAGSDPAGHGRPVPAAGRGRPEGALTGGMSARAAVGLNRDYFTGARTLGPASTSLRVACGPGHLLGGL